MMRLFIAINFNDEIKKLLSKAADELKNLSVSGSFTRPENLHLTLIFIGETDRLSDIKHCLDSVECPPFKVAVGSAYGCFGTTLWAGVKADEELNFLVKTLRRALLEKGFKIDERRFKPHVTLARSTSDCPTAEMSLSSAAMVVNSISLMKSERINGLLTYTDIYKRHLNGAARQD